MQAEENSDSEGEEGQAFYAGGSERRYVYVTVVLVKFGFRLKFFKLGWFSIVFVGWS